MKAYLNSRVKFREEFRPFAPAVLFEHAKDYFEMKQEKDAELSYLDYLAIEHDCFFTRLITCVMCLGFWITLIVCMSTGKLHNLPLYYVGSLVAYGLTFKI